MPPITRRLIFSLCAFWIASCFCATLSANDEISVAELKLVENRVANVVAKNMEACVAITDGAGFGSGVIVSPNGLVLTAAHVIESSGPYELILPSGRTVRAKALGKNLNIDAGLMQIIDPGPWPCVKPNLNQRVDDGNWVVSIGHSGGYELGRTPPVRTGRVLKQDRDQLFTDAVLIGGDSGGPLFDLEGQLVGIHSSIGDTIAENRDVTMTAIGSCWDRLKVGESWGRLPNLDDPREELRRGIIGVRVDLEAEQCRIRLVNAGSPADEAGVEIGDIVLTFNSVKIRDGRHLIAVIKKHYAGDVCTMTVRRGATTLKLELQLQ